MRKTLHIITTGKCVNCGKELKMGLFLCENCQKLNERSQNDLNPSRTDSVGEDDR